jgi:hypothetical protein
MDLPSMIKNRLIEYYIEREFGGSKLAEARSESLARTADELYRKAGQMRKEAQALHQPRRT